MPVWSKLIVSYQPSYDSMERLRMMMQYHDIPNEERLVPLYNEKEVSERMARWCKEMRAAGDLQDNIDTLRYFYASYSLERADLYVRCMRLQSKARELLKEARVVHEDVVTKQMECQSMRTFLSMKNNTRQYLLNQTNEELDFAEWVATQQLASHPRWLGPVGMLAVETLRAEEERLRERPAEEWNLHWHMSTVIEFQDKQIRSNERTLSNFEHDLRLISDVVRGLQMHNCNIVRTSGQLSEHMPVAAYNRIFDIYAEMEAGFVHTSHFSLYAEKLDTNYLLLEELRVALDCRRVRTKFSAEEVKKYDASNEKQLVKQRYHTDGGTLRSDLRRHYSKNCEKGQQQAVFYKNLYASVNRKIEERLHQAFGSGVKLTRQTDWRWVKKTESKALEKWEAWCQQLD